MRHSQRAHKKDGGYVIIILSLLFAAIGLALVVSGAVPVISHYASVRGYSYSKQAFLASNSAIDEAMYRLMVGKNLPSTVSLTVGSSTATIQTTATPSGKEVTVSGVDFGYERDLVADLAYAGGVAFNYGLQAGDRGVTIGGGSTVNGNIYSNASINAVSATITGTAVAATSTGLIGGATYVGGVQIGGDAWAPTVKGASVQGSLYCTTGSNNNKACDASRGVPPSQPLPYTDANIAGWKSDAQSGGTISGNYSVGWQGATIGPKEITGNLTVNGGGILTMTGTLYVHGNVTVNGGGKIVLPSNFGKSSGTIISDGLINISGGSSAGSGSSGSYLFLVSTSACPYGTGCSGQNAISVSGGAGAIAVSAQWGVVGLSGGCQLSAAAGSGLNVAGGSTVNYDTGLASPVFNSGPSGGYTISSWKEN